jgi:hypothetical protein
MLLFYVIGLPLSITYILFKNKKTIQTGDRNSLVFAEVHSRFSFFFHGYKPDFFWWECAILLRKVVSIMCISFWDGTN